MAQKIEKCEHCNQRIVYSTTLEKWIRLKPSPIGKEHEGKPKS